MKRLTAVSRDELPTATYSDQHRNSITTCTAVPPPRTMNISAPPSVYRRSVSINTNRLRHWLGRAFSSAMRRTNYLPYSAAECHRRVSVLTNGASVLRFDGATAKRCSRMYVWLCVAMCHSRRRLATFGFDCLYFKWNRCCSDEAQLKDHNIDILTLYL